MSGGSQAVQQHSEHLSQDGLLLCREPINQGLLVGKPADVAALAFFLAPPAASQITGQVLHVNGGRAHHLTGQRGDPCAACPASTTAGRS